MLPLTCKSLAGTMQPFAFDIYQHFMARRTYMLAAMPLRCFNTLWHGIRYTPWYMLVICSKIL